MPGFRAHHFFGNEILERLPRSRAMTNIKKHPTVFNLGLQGPDLFFYAVPSHLIHKENTGAILHHDKTGEFFKALIKSKNRLKNSLYREIAEAYICGFMGHYTLDTTAHPYVHYRTKKTSGGSATHIFGSHLQLETDLDAMVLKHYTHKSISAFSCSDAITLSEAERFAVAILLHTSIKSVYPETTLHLLEIFHAIWSTRRLFSILPDPLGAKKRAFRRFDQTVFGHAYLSGIFASDTVLFHDPANLRHRLWKNPWDTRRISNEDFYALFERGQEDYVRRLKLYIAGKMNELYEDLGNLSYDKGLTVH